MTNEQRIACIIERLTSAFHPSLIDVIDNSPQHIGHAGAAGGAGHFELIIDKECFGNLSRVAIHQQIYQALGDLIPGEIHALSIRLHMGND